MTRSQKIKLTAITALLALQVLYAEFVTQPGHFTVDEGVYHMMARSMAQEGSLAVWNGYAETPSEEMVYSLLRKDLRDPSAPRLVPQYPSVYAVLAVPFYLAGGFAGLFWINLLAFFGTVWATIAMARRLYGDGDVALNAVLILVLGTFSWEYVQAVWPHSLSMFLVTSAVLAGLVALDKTTAGEQTRWSVLAGLIVGLATGIRYDAILVAPALAIAFLFSSQHRMRPMLGLAAGLTPGLLLLALTNNAKFGILSPFTYGSDSHGGASSIFGYAALAAGLGGAVALVWVGARPRVREFLGDHPFLLAAGGVTVVAAILVVTPLRDLCLRLIQGSWEIVVDLRYRPDIAEWGVSRTPTGGLAYDEWLKKALLQNCPWLVIVAASTASWLRRPSARQALPLMVIGAFIALYGYQRWHGGMGLNMRYFLSFLPLAAILAAAEYRNLSQDLSTRWRRILTGAGLASTAIWIPLITSDSTLAIEPVLLDTPLAIAAALAAALILTAMPIAAIRKGARMAALATGAAGLAWAFTVAFIYDLPRSTGTRSFNYLVGTDIRSLIEPDSILFTRYANRVSLLLDDDIRLAFPRNDDFADFPRLVGVHIDQGRHVYLAFNEDYWQRVEEGKFLAGLETEELYENGDVRLVRVYRPQQ